MSLLLVLVVMVIVIVVFLGAGAVAVIVLTGRSRERRQKRSIEMKKIDSMLAQGKITEEEAAELKKAIGIVPLFPEALKEDKHIRTLSLLETIYSVVGVVFFVPVLLIALMFLWLAPKPVGGNEFSQRQIQDQMSYSFNGNGSQPGSPKPPTIQFKHAPQARSAVSGQDVAVAAITVCIILALAFVLLRLIAALKLRNGSGPAKIIILILSVLDLTSFPLGTALGIYAFWILLFRDGAEDYYAALAPAKTMEMP